MGFFACGLVGGFQLVQLLQLPITKLCEYCSVRANPFLAAAIANNWLLVFFCGYDTSTSSCGAFHLVKTFTGNLERWPTRQPFEFPARRLLTVGDCRRLAAKRRHFPPPPKGVQVPRRLSRHIKDGMPARHFGSTLKTKLNIEPGNFCLWYGQK